MTIETKDTFETANLTMAAALSTLGYQVSRIRITGRNKTMGVFYFDNVPEKICQDFDEGRLRIEPTIFHIHIKRMSSMVKGVTKEIANG